MKWSWKGSIILVGGNPFNNTILNFFIWNQINKIYIYSVCLGKPAEDKNQEPREGCQAPEVTIFWI